MRSRTALALSAAVLVSVGAIGCDTDTAGPEPPYNLTLRGNETFQQPHGGQSLRAALTRDGVVLAQGTTTVSATATPSFELVFEDILEWGVEYELHYWIDSNFNGGTEGTCDPPANDHQWAIGFPGSFNHLTITDSHRPGETEDVCATFTTP